MRIGSSGPSFVQSARSAPLAQVGGRAPDFSGGGMDGSGLFAASRAITAYGNQRFEEEERKRDFEAQKEYYRVVGETQRQQDELFQNAPANGSGVVAGSAELWERNFSGFLSNLSPELQERYAAVGENVKQDYLRRAEGQERSALRGDAMFTLDQFRADAASRLIADPGSRDALEAQYLGLLSSAPGLTAAERQAYARQGLQTFAQSAAAGGLFRNNQQRFVDPNSDDFELAIVPAVVAIESSGRADAVSPMGATGLMQVMPGTARGIARELGDQSFPHDFPDEAVQEYLKNPEVSMRYGKYYLRKRLNEFGGDLEAALIAYNAGAGNARRWLNAGRDYSVLPKRSETEPYVQRIFERLGITAEEDILSDPDLPADAKLTLAAQARRQGLEVQNEAAQALRNRREAAVAQLNVDIDGGGGVVAIQRAVEVGTITPGTAEYDAAIRRREKVEAEQIAFEGAMVRLADPNQTFDATKESRDELGLIAQRSAAVEGLTNRNMEAVNEVVLPLWRQTGVAPTNVKQTLTMMAQSTDPQDSMFAHEVLNAMLQHSPDAFVREYGDALTDRLGAYGAMKGAGFSEQELALLMSQRRTPEQMNQLEALTGQATTYLREDFSMDRLRASFSSYVPSWFGGLKANYGDNPLQTAIAAELMSEYSLLYKQLYPLYQDEAAADRAVVESIARRYGPMPDGTLIKYPPDRYVPQFEGSHEWFTRQFNRQVGLADGESVRWISSPNAEERVLAGGVPSYRFAIIRDGGVIDAGEFVPDIAAEREFRKSLEIDIPEPERFTVEQLDTLQRLKRISPIDYDRMLRYYEMSLVPNITPVDEDDQTNALGVP